jgi:hypothetical protein
LKIIAFDIDDVLLTRDPQKEDLGINKYNYCFPITKNINFLNECYDNGFYIKLYTARGMSTLKGDLTEIKKNLSVITEETLKKYNVKYHELIFGKTHYDLLIDDKAHNISNFNTLQDVEKYFEDIK